MAARRSLSIGPFPSCDVGPVYPEPISILFARDPLVGQFTPEATRARTHAGDAVAGVHGQGEAVGLVADGQLERRVDVALFLVAAHVDVVLARPPVGESVDQPGISVEGAARNNARAALNFLDQQPPDLGEVGEALGCVVDDADRAGLIVDRIRDHIRKAPPRKHRFDLNEAIKEVIVLARSAIAENGVSVQTRLTEGLAPIEGDRVQLQQVILNLALNAAEAMNGVRRGGARVVD
jgi:signal transduction histidine kinase